MSWNPYNQLPASGPVNPNFSITNIGEVTTQGSDASTTPPFLPSAPNRSQLITAGAVTFPNTQTQQGQQALVTTDIYSGAFTRQDRWWWQ